MTERSREKRLQALTAEAGHALRRRAQRLTSPPVLAVTPDSGSRRGTSPGSSTSAVEATSGVAGVKTPREERSVRALAKEIKRLLTEDRRRGLGIGG